MKNLFQRCRICYLQLVSDGSQLFCAKIEKQQQINAHPLNRISTNQTQAKKSQPISYNKQMAFTKSKIQHNRKRN